MTDRTVIACTAEDIDMSFERWREIMDNPERCQQFGCYAEADRECSWCRSLFCAGHSSHDCIRGTRCINEFGETAP